MKYNWFRHDPTVVAVVQWDLEQQMVFADRPFVWDPMLLIQPPAGVHYAVLAAGSTVPGGVYVGKLEPPTCFAAITALAADIHRHFDAAVPPAPIFKFSAPHVRSLIQRICRWQGYMAGREHVQIDRWQDLVELINEPAVLDLQDRRSWCAGRLMDAGLIPSHALPCTQTPSGSRMVSPYDLSVALQQVSERFNNPL